MDLKDYFENTKGTGVLATADKAGRANAAIYSRPHFFEDGTVGFIMRQRLTHANLQENPHACYLFVEAATKSAGRRLYLTKVAEEKETERLYQLKRRETSPESDAEKGPKYLAVFTLDKVLPLIGDTE